MKFTALFALFPPMKFLSEFRGEMFWKAISFFEKPREIRIIGNESHKGEVICVWAEKCSTTTKNRYFKQNMVFRPGSWMLRFESDLCFPGRAKFDMREADGTPSTDSDEELERFWLSITPSVLDLDIHTYFLAMALAFPGALHVVQNVWLVDRRRHYHSSSYISVANESIDFIAENGFLPDTDLDPQSVLSWVHQQNGIFFGRSDTAASRALNYFTRQFVRSFRSDEMSDLVWAVAAIEGLLVESGRSSVGQLKEKLQALFKNHEKCGWLIDSVERMYSYRSKMIHGNRQIRSAFRDDEDDSGNRIREEADSANLATGLLVILLQRLIREKRNRYEFQLSVV